MTHSFANMPTVGISRSKFDRTSRHPTSFNLGDIVPIYVDEVLPGDTRKLDLGALVRMSTPIAPIMDDIELSIHAFFVPNRLVYDDWKTLMGENKTGAGAVNYAIFTVPTVSVGTQACSAGHVGDYMGLPYLPTGPGSSVSYDVSVLPIRGYRAIYNRWYRNQNLIAPAYVPLGSANTTYDKYDVACFKASKVADYFTKALPYAQKGNPVLIPLGDIPVITGNDIVSSAFNYQTPAMHLKQQSGSAQIAYTGVVAANGSNNGSTQLQLGTSGISLSSGDLFPTNLWAKGVLAAQATINNLRLAFQTQKLLEKDAMYGTRYWEILYAHFGVKSPDASLQDPEYLGGVKFMINIDQVLQMTGYANDATSELGQPGANSVTGWKGSVFTKSFIEHGFLHVYAVARQKHHTYSQGLNRMFSRTGRYDFYWPVFANLGAQEIKNKEIWAGSSSSNNSPFGYQEAWADYRYKPSHVSGILNPGRSGSLDYWTLAEAYANMPTLSQGFVEESRANLSRCLTTGSSGPDFIADFYFKDIAVRPMPTYSIPGLVDHH